MNSIYDSITSIRETEKHFDFNSNSEDVLSTISAMSGWSNNTPAQDLEANGDAGLSAQDALAAKGLQSNSALQALIGTWKTRYTTYKDKMESDKTKADERLSLLSKSIELKLVLADIAGLFEDAAEYQPSTPEKLLGAKSPSSTSTPDIDEILEPTLTEQQKRDANTKTAALFIKNAVKADQFFRENPAKKE